MGERANIFILMPTKDNPHAGVNFYTHWHGGYHLHSLRNALAKNWRWDDKDYLARIIFDELVHEHGTETGYGIGLDMPDNEWNIGVVDTVEKKVRVLYGRTMGGGEIPWDNDVIGEWSYEDFSKLDDETLDEVSSPYADKPDDND